MNIVVSKHYAPEQKKEIFNSLQKAAAKHSSKNDAAIYMTGIFDDNFGEEVVKERHSGRELKIKWRDQEYLRKFLSQSFDGVSGAHQTTWRYLDIICSLLNQAQSSGLNPGILEQFGQPTINCIEAMNVAPCFQSLPAQFVCESQQVGVESYPGVLEIHPLSSDQVFPVTFWVKKDAIPISVREVNTFIQGNQPNPYVFSKWEGIGCCVETWKYESWRQWKYPHSLKILIREFRTLAAGNLLVEFDTSAQQEFPTIASLHTPNAVTSYTLSMLADWCQQ